MKHCRLISYWLLTMILGAGHDVAAQPSAITTAQAVNLIQDLLARSVEPLEIVDALIEAGVSLEDTLSQLALFTNNSTPDEAMDALVDMGMSVETAVSVMSAMISNQMGDEKVHTLSEQGVSREDAAMLLAVLGSSRSARLRLRRLMGMGLSLEESSQYLVYLTISLSPEELIPVFMRHGMTPQAAILVLMTNNPEVTVDSLADSLGESGLTLAGVEDLFAAMDDNGEFDIVGEIPAPNVDFNTDILTGTATGAGGGVSTNQ